MNVEALILRSINELTKGQQRLKVGEGVVVGRSHSPSSWAIWEMPCSTPSSLQHIVLIMCNNIRSITTRFFHQTIAHLLTLFSAPLHQPYSPQSGRGVGFWVMNFSQSYSRTIRGFKKEEHWSSKNFWANQMISEHGRSVIYAMFLLISPSLVCSVHSFHWWQHLRQSQLLAYGILIQITTLCLFGLAAHRIPWSLFLESMSVEVILLWVLQARYL